MNEKPLKEYVSLEKRKKEIAAELKQVTADLNRLEVVVVDEIVNAGVQEVTVDGRILKPVPAIFCSPAKGRLAVVQRAARGASRRVYSTGLQRRAPAQLREGNGAGRLCPRWGGGPPADAEGGRRRSAGAAWTGSEDLSQPRVE